MLSDRDLNVIDAFLEVVLGREMIMRLAAGRRTSHIELAQVEGQPERVVVFADTAMIIAINVGPLLAPPTIATPALHH